MLALSAIAAPIAAASERPEWWVQESLFKGTEAIAETTEVAEPFKLTLTLEGKSVVGVIVCGGVKVKHGQIEHRTERSEEAVVFEKCEIEGEPGCTVATTTTNPLKAKLEGPPGEIKLRFKPQSGTEIATYVVSGSPCKVPAGSYRATGEMICNYSEVEAELIDHPLEFTSTSGSAVEVNGQPSEFTGTDVVHLASEKRWSARF